MSMESNIPPGRQLVRVANFGEGGRRFAAKLTTSGGSFPQWSYTCQRITGYRSANAGLARWLTDGINLTGCLNVCETAGTPPYTYGTGNLITSVTGQINSTSCLIVAIGPRVVTLNVLYDRSTGSVVRWFEAENAAQ